MDTKPKSHRWMAWEFPVDPDDRWQSDLLYDWGVWRFGRTAIPFYIILWPYVIVTVVSSIIWISLQPYINATASPGGYSQASIDDALAFSDAVPWLPIFVGANLAILGAFLVIWGLRALFSGIASEIRKASKGYR